jgi:serine/threonine protein kinase
MAFSAAGNMESSRIPSDRFSRLTAQYLIAPEEIRTDQTSPLGRNRRGRVFKGFWNDNPISAKVLSDEASVDTLLDRIQAWQSLRHPHVLQVFGISLINSGPSYIISQYYSNGDVNEFLGNNPGTDRAKLMFECALGMQYLHERGLVHGNLKPTNILIADNGQVCIADYGMIEIEPSGNARSYQYFSPEAWKGVISKPSDVFAFAMSSYEVFMAMPPWGVLPNKNIHQLVVRENDRPDRLDLDFERKRGLTDQIWKIMQAAWQKDANSRPTFAQIIQSWEILPQEGSVVPVRPVSSSSSGGDLGDGSTIGHSFYEPQTTQNNISTSQSNMDSDTVSTLSLPPAYPDISTQQPFPPANRQSYADDLTSAITTSRSPSIMSPPYDGSRSFGLPSDGSENGYSPLASTFRSPDSMMTLSPSTSLRRSYPPGSTPRTLSMGETVPLRFHSQLYERFQVPDIVRRDSAYNGDPNRLNERFLEAPGNDMMSDTLSITSSSQQSRNTQGQSSAVLLVSALHAEVTEGRKQEVIDYYLCRVQSLSSQSDKEAQKLVTAGIVPTVILLLKARAVDGVGLELVLVTLGILACDPITANTIYRTNTASTLIEIFKSSRSDNIMALSAWCIARICRSAEVATGLIKQDLAVLLIQKGLNGNLISSRSSAWCLGILPYTDSLAQTLTSYDIVKASVDHLRRVTAGSDAQAEDKCAAIYVIARMARTIQLSKSLLRAGCVPLIVHHLSTAEDPQVLQWSARAVGCLMRPSGSDIAKTLIDAGSAGALARLPRVLDPEVAEPLASFAFAIQRFSVAEWGSGTRKALVEAGVVDSLLAALRTSADIACPLVHIELALAVSFLGDVGGTSIRKEIVKAGGIDILKHVSAASTKSEVAKACDLAVTSITGNFWTRNAASAKTTMSHNWTGGCPEHQPPCPLTLPAE